ncbi:hypothetical protein L4C36_01165 [Photobacterium japonica]|uniref:hypothetical protein n=1 Tax=Photobacterium japonica TaxID=2910235 RepID=UPI003D11C39E
MIRIETVSLWLILALYSADPIYQRDSNKPYRDTSDASEAEQGDNHRRHGIHP